MTVPRSVPLLGDISLEFIQRMEHSLDGILAATRVSGLNGELQQHSGRPSHRILIRGVLYGEDAADTLSKLQSAAQTGNELTFSADITTALDLQKVVITSFRAVESAGHPGRFSYETGLAESPPLPPPASLDPFGGLGDFGLGDLGFDTDLLSDLQDAAGQVAGAIDAAMSIVNQLGALSSLDGLSLGSGLLGPVSEKTGAIGEIGAKFGAALGDLTKAFT
jgi:hypothetical protein